MNKPLNGESLSDSVRSTMERELLTGVLAPGHVLDERSLAERFGVSRTPVREAVAQLASQGLLKVIPRVGVVVPKVSIKELLSILEMLAELEGICAKFAAKRMDARQRKGLKDAVAACEAAASAGKPSAYQTANLRFHEAIYAGARNEWAAQQIRALRLRSASYGRTRFDLPGRLDKSLAEHRAVLTCIDAGDSEGARQAMVEHISIGGRDFAEIVSSMETEALAE